MKIALAGLALLVFLVAFLAFLAAGCSTRREEPASRMTEAQRDSALARSNVPGARAVDRAFAVSGREAAHAAALDTLPTQ